MQFFIIYQYDGYLFSNLYCNKMHITFTYAAEITGFILSQIKPRLRIFFNMGD